MPLKPLFFVFQDLIEQRFSSAKLEAGNTTKDVVLELHEEPLKPQRLRAEFLVIEPSGPVRITWNGIASLWAFAQGAARLCERMYDGRRAGNMTLRLSDDPEAQRGMDCLVLARRFCSGDVPVESATSKHWPKWAPRIDPDPVSDSDDEKGNQFFLGALGWIFRHELAHLALDHASREGAGTVRAQQCEIEADVQATTWIRGDRKADPVRKVGSRPGTEELELEFRAIVIGIGLIWVAMFESDSAQRGDSHPPVAERLSACLDSLKLREDSPAKEILADLIQAWIRPERDAPVPVQNSDAAFSVALVDLHRMMQSGDVSWTGKIY